MKNKEQRRSSDIDWFSMIVPLLGVVAVCIYIFVTKTVRDNNTEGKKFLQ